jgi:tetratricopeptide (TPR) repeat protein
METGIFSGGAGPSPTPPLELSSRWNTSNEQYVRRASGVNRPRDLAEKSYSVEDEKHLLLRQLHSTDPEVREKATNRMWQLWFGAAGPEAEQRLLYGERLLQGKEHEKAESALTDLIRDFPSFAEGWNRRATMRYLRRQYEASLSDCREVVRLEPDHFGAWHGTGLNLIELHRYAEAARAFRRALEIQPFAEANQELLATCLAKLN